MKELPCSSHTWLRGVRTTQARLVLEDKVWGASWAFHSMSLPLADPGWSFFLKKKIRILILFLMNSFYFWLH